MAKDLDLIQSALRNWVERDKPRPADASVSEAEHKELQQLRKGVRVLRMKRDL